MSDISSTEDVGIPRKPMTLFFVVDASGSMDGSKIGAVNAAIENVIPDLKDISEGNADAQIKVAALEFSSGARWLTPDGPVEIGQFYWKYIDAGGVTDLGAACKALNEKLSTKAFMREATGSYAPVIFLMSDGEPTDDWQSGLDILKQNNWFKVGIKAAIAIGDDANKEVLKAFTGTMESVLEVHNPTMLKRMIQFVAVTSSQVASKSSNASNLQTDMGDEQKQLELNAALEELKIEVAAAPNQEEDIW
jgi:uncharacterized protein YegL